MNTPKRLYFLRAGFPAICIAYILFCRFYEPAAEWYARHIYPTISYVLSSFAAIFPFSLEEILVVGCIIYLIVYPFTAHRKGVRKRTICLKELETLLWIYVWFYLGWGLNYYRNDFYIRTASAQQPFNQQIFEQFICQYTDSLHTYYTPQYNLPQDTIAQIIRQEFATLPKQYGLLSPRSYQAPKYLLFNSLYSNVGVLGFMGPFFCEMQLNHELQPAQYAFTYAHEMSHLLGVSNEAEANFWAYYLCTRSNIDEIKSSGYFNMLPYIMINVRNLTDDQFYMNWLNSLNPEIITHLRKQQDFWRTRYNPCLGKAQELIYECYLKGNRIHSGQKNYSEVVGLIMAFDKNHKHQQDDIPRAE